MSSRNKFFRSFLGENPVFGKPISPQQPPNAGTNTQYQGNQSKNLTRRTNTGITPYVGAFGKPELIHLLRRSLFGVKMADISAFTGKTLEQTVDALLTVSSTLPNPPLNDYGNTNNDPNVIYGQTWINAPYDAALNNFREKSLKRWFWDLMANQSTDLQAKMVLFWHNHFAIQFLEIPLASASYVYSKLLFTHALGNVKTLTRAITIDPAMLFYLNGRLNTKRAPDENYARELQELFAIGKGTNSNYTEDDVKAMARVLTGWSINILTNPASTGFVASNHDTNDKQFSSFYGNAIIKGQTGIDAGNKELDDLLSMIFKTEESAAFLCRKLYTYFVYYEIDDTVEAKVIQPLAKVFRESGYDIKTVLKILLMSEHFFDNWNRACVIKDPITQQGGLCRQMELAFPVTTDYAQMYKMFQMGVDYGSLTQMVIGDPPNVSGWPAWYQKPVFNRSWINNDTLPKRNLFSDSLLVYGQKVGTAKVYVDPWIVTKKFSAPGTADTLIADAIEFLLPMALSTKQIASLKEILLPGAIPDYNWSDEYLSATDVSDPNHTKSLNTATIKLRSLYKSIMNLAEYQLS